MRRVTLSDYGYRTVIFLLSNYRNIEYRIGEFKKLWDYWISHQGLKLSEYRISDTENTIGCPPLLINR
jgi:hypothetical protein